ncbi:MAG: hypothetical protein ACYCW6_20380 [Candidatus Xenobia bacterium]
MTWKRALSVGCLVVVVACGLFGWWSYQQIRQIQGDLQSPSVGQTVMQEVLPGTTFPAPYAPSGGAHFMGVSAAIVMPSGTKGGHTLMIMVIGLPPNSKKTPDQVQQALEQQTHRGGPTQVISSTTETETVQGEKRPFEKRIVMQQGIRQTEYVGLLQGPNKQSVVLMILGPEKAFPQADFQAVLAAVKKY